MAYFKADICNDMTSASKAVLDAMRADFEQPPPDVRAKILTCSASPASRARSGGGICWCAKVTLSTASWSRSTEHMWYVGFHAVR